MEGFSSLVSSLIVPIPSWSDGYRYCVDCYSLKIKGIELINY